MGCFGEFCIFCGLPAFILDSRVATIFILSLGTADVCGVDLTMGGLAMSMKQFKNKKDDSSVYVMLMHGEWWLRFTEKRQLFNTVEKIGPFATEGDALLAACMTKQWKFSEYRQVYPK
jgi:hypothetical protein